MTSVLKKYILPVFVVAVAWLCAWGIHKNYTYTKEEIRKNMAVLFNEALHRDKDIRETETPFYFYSQIDTLSQPSDSLRIETEDSVYYVKKSDDMCNKTHDERKFVYVQMFLMSKNPIRVCELDSIFRSVLQKKHIPAETAVIYEANGIRQYSTADSSFYASALKVDEVLIGLEQEMVLYGYAKLPVSYIMAKSLPIYILVVLICCIGIAWFWTWKRNRKVVILPSTTVSREVILLRDDLAYDKNNGVLIYNGQEIILTNYKLNLFNLLLESEGQYLPSDTLQTAIWADGLSTKDALMQTVKRLRKELECISGLKIENLRGNGYRLLIEPPETEESHF